MRFPIVAITCALLVCLLAAPAAAQTDGRTGCAIYGTSVREVAGSTILVLQLVDWFPARAMLYDGSSRLAMPPSRFLSDVGDTGAANWAQYPYQARFYDDLEPGTYTGVFAGVSGGFSYDFEIEAGTITTVTIECM